VSRMRTLLSVSPWVLLILVSTKTNANVKDCTAGGGTPCQFPYVYKGRTHFECTTEAPGSADLVGKCPTRLVDSGSRLADTDPSSWSRCDRGTCPLQKYTPNSEISAHLTSLASRFPSLASVMEVGASVLGQNITGIRISRGVTSGPRELLKPMVRYVGNMHGNEPVGRELLNHFAETLLEGYGIVDSITELVDTTDITIIPTMNPDGFDRGTEGACSGADYATGRFNEENIDLNRNFPTWADVNKTREELFAGRQVETQHMMRLILREPWVLSANFHDGAVVASYPYDDYGGKPVDTGIAATPDHSFFKHLASSYATSHLTMLDQSVCTRWFFYDGITNGADWYALYGGMQDFNYLYTNDMEITLELSCCKYPSK